MRAPATRRRWSPARLLRGGLIALAVHGASAASAAPLDESAVAGLGFSGPTSGDLGAVYWNPAALGLLAGSQMMLAGTARSSSIEVDRAPIDPATGAAGGSRSFPTAHGSSSANPATWPPGPGGFLGAGLDVAGRFTIALAAFMPFAQRLQYDPSAGGEQPTRYHALSVDLRNVALVPALSFRIGRNLNIGLAPGFLFSSAHFTFDEDTALDGGGAGLGADCGGAPCAAENGRAAARADLRSSLSPFNTSPSFTLGGGVLYRLGPVMIGVSYTSRPLGKPSGGVEVDATETSILAPGGGSLCADPTSSSCASARLQYRLPDTLVAGATWQINPRVEVTGIVRWLNESVHDRVAVRLVGPATPGLAAAGIPERFYLYRGWQDSLDVRLRGSMMVKERYRLGVQLRVETSAVPQQAVNPAAIDGFKIEPALLAAVKVWRLTLTAGYAVTLMPEVNVTTSAFDPAAATACANANGDLVLPACQTRLAGAARPTAAGRYRQFTQTFGLTTTLRF